MDFMTLAENRYSVRKFDPRKVEPEKVEQILRAGQLAPTAKNQQPQRILVLQSEQALEKLGKVTVCTFGCTLALMVCYDDTLSWKRPFDGKDSGDIDAAIAATHMMLAARELGIGSTWVMFFDPDAARKQFELPEHIHPTAILVMGYPAADAAPSDRHAVRQPLSVLAPGEHL